MAICGSRCESIVTAQAKTGGARTGLIFWLNNGTASMESHRNVGAANLSSSVLGDALGAAGEADRAKARKPAKALNDRAIASA